MSVIPGELEADGFIEFAMNKHFKLLDFRNSIVIGNYDVHGMKGIAA